jgi:hypothetical protein
MPSIGTRLQGPFASEEPNQYKRKVGTFDPLQNLPAEKTVSRDYIFNLGDRTRPFSGNYGSSGSTFVGPREGQQYATAGLRGAADYATPYFTSGVDTLEKTARGEYLDPTQNPAFRNLQDTSRTYAQDLFSDLAGDVDTRAARLGIYNSSAREAQRNRAGERVTNQIANQLANQAYAQYGAERGLQQGAAREGSELAPRFAQQLFQDEEQLRGAEQQAGQFQQQMQYQQGIAKLREHLENAGLDQRAIDNMLRFLQVAQVRPVEPVIGPSDAAANRAQISTDVNVLGGVMGAL